MDSRTFELKAVNPMQGRCIYIRLGVMWKVKNKNKIIWNWQKYCEWIDPPSADFDGESFRCFISEGHINIKRLDFYFFISIEVSRDLQNHTEKCILWQSSLIYVYIQYFLVIFFFFFFTSAKAIPDPSAVTPSLSISKGIWKSQ